MIGLASVFNLLFIIGGALSFRLGLLPFGIGFSIFGLGLGGCAILSLIVGALIFRRLARKQRLARLPLWLVFSLLPVIVVVQQVGLAGFQAPPIHDISTDLAHPPAFVFAQAERGPGDNSLVYAGEALAEQQRSSYPQLVPLHLRESKTAVWAEVMTLIANNGWRLLGVDKSQGHIEAAITTPLMAFTDDIVIRLSAKNVVDKSASDDGATIQNGVIVDVRSASRVGVSDLGANAARVEKFFNELQNQLNK